MKRIYLLIVFIALLGFGCSQPDNSATTTQAATQALAIISPQAMSTVIPPFTISGLVTEGIIDIIVTGSTSPKNAEIDGGIWNVTIEESDTTVGLQNFTFTGKDSGGKIQATVQISLNVSNDVFPPTVAIDKPEANAVVVSGTFTVSGTAEDSSGIASVYAALDSGSYQTVDGTNQWNTVFSSVADGMHTVSVFAIDGKGNISVTNSVSFSINTALSDTIAPILTITAPGEGEEIGHFSVVVSGTASDAGGATSTLKKVMLSLGGLEYSAVSGTTGWSTNLSGLANGTYTAYVYAEDYSGNHSITNSVTFTINTSGTDITSPSVVIALPAENEIVESGQLNVSGTASDPGSPASGIMDVLLSVDGSAMKRVNGTVNWYTNLSGLTEGAHVIRVIARDNHGNVSATNVRNITVDLPDDIWAEYYANAYGLTGNALKAALHGIIDHHTVLPYTSYSPDVWDALEDIDEDPDHTDNVILIYTRRSQEKYYKNSSHDISMYSNGISDAWEREHTWPKSKGFPDEDDWAAPYTDVHHLRPVDRTVNSSRSDTDYGYGSSVHSEAVLCKIGPYWEAPDEVKGDLARQMFYMAVRYEGDAPGEPDLELVNYTTSPISDGNGYMGMLDDLLEWHLNDPVSDAERLRNNNIYSNWQHNRNPFIDHPEWVTNIW